MKERIDPRDINALQRHQDQADAAELLAREQLIADIQWLMADVRGRRLMGHVLAMAGTGRSSFTGNSATFYNEGRRAVGIELEAELREHAFDPYITMLQEQRQ